MNVERRRMILPTAEQHAVLLQRGWSTCLQAPGWYSQANGTRWWWSVALTLPRTPSP
jgi:hypothetical protein